MTEIRFGYTLSSEIESQKQGTIANSTGTSFPDKFGIKTMKLRVPEVDKEPGNVVFLGLGSELEENICMLRIGKTLLDLWDSIEELLNEASFDKEKIDRIVTENEEHIHKIKVNLEKRDLNM